MNNDSEEKKTIDEEVKKIVIERIRAMSPELQLHIGGDAQVTYTKNQLLQNVTDGSEFGKKLIKDQLEFMQAVASGKLYQTLQDG